MKRFALALALAFFSVSLEAKSPRSTDKVWVIVRPVQCLGNPWEKDWLAHNHNQAAKYPRAHEADVIKSYFSRKKMPILDIRIKPYVNGDPLCQACDCSRGDTFFFLVQAHNVPKLVRMGYTERLPANETPLKK